MVDMSRSSAASRLSLFGQWLRNPRQTAAIAPSSPELVAAIIAELPEGTRKVIELGGGTGAITTALASKVAARDLLVIELNSRLYQQLHARHPESRVIRGDAIHTAELALRHGFLEDGPVDAVVSGLGLLAMSRDVQSAILQSAFACLHPDGVLIQFTYGPLSPVNEGLLSELGYIARRGSFVLRNAPPATVWTIRRSRTRAIRPRTVYR